MKHKRLSIIGSEPVSLAEARRQCFVTKDTEEENNHLRDLIAAARDYAEKETWRAIIPSQYIGFSDSFPDEIELPYPPAISVEKIEYINTDGDTVEMDLEDVYIDTLSEPARIKPVSNWPSTKSGVYNAVQVTYKAGYQKEGATDNVPKGIKNAIKLLIKHFYDNPEAVVVSGGGITVHEVPKGVDDLLGQESARVFA